MRLGLRILQVVLFGAYSVSLLAQDSIPLQNGSFEWVPKQSNIPTDWKDCGFRGESPPDIHPLSDSISFWSVRQTAYEGNTFLGMVVRDNETYESVAQRLTTPMEADACYEMTIALCRSDVYLSPSRVTGQMANYNEAAVLRVYGGSGICDRAELLFETRPIANTDWEVYTISCKPKFNHQSIIFEAFYETPILFPYNGNILVDEASALHRVVCPEDIVQLEEEEGEAERGKAVVKIPEQRTKTESTTPKKQFKAPKILTDLDMEKVREGQTMRIKDLRFSADSTNIAEEDQQVLDDIYHFMDYYPGVTLEVGGHTNLKPNKQYAESLSKARAQAVVDYLVEKGIDPNRFKVVGYGKSKPIVNSVNRIANSLNQRVEIKFLSMGE